MSPIYDNLDSRVAVTTEFVEHVININNIKYYIPHKCTI